MVKLMEFSGLNATCPKCGGKFAARYEMRWRTEYLVRTCVSCGWRRREKCADAEVEYLRFGHSE